MMLQTTLFKPFSPFVSPFLQKFMVNGPFNFYFQPNDNRMNNQLFAFSFWRFLIVNEMFVNE